VTDHLVPRARVQVIAPSSLQGFTGTILKHYPVTGQCLVEFPASKGISWIADECLEVLA
jgi:hypothetical protein